MNRKDRIKLFKELQFALAAAITLSSQALDVSAATSKLNEVKVYADNYSYATAGIGVEMVSESELTKKKNRTQRREDKRRK